MAFKIYKKESKSNWGADSESLSLEQINTGCLQRIADATEAMAKNHNDLMSELQWAKDRRDNYQRLWHGEQNKNRTMKGNITKLKKQIAALQAQINPTNNV